MPTQPTGWNGDGEMRGFRISKVARYSEEFKPLQQLKSDDDTVLLFDFATKDEKLLKDVSGNKRDGRIHHAEWVKPSQ